MILVLEENQLPIFLTKSNAPTIYAEIKSSTHRSPLVLFR